MTHTSAIPLPLPTHTPPHLDAEDVCPFLHQALGQVHVVAEVVLGLAGVGDVAGVGDGRLHHAACRGQRSLTNIRYNPEILSQEET